uniref:SCP domain-containing protein n=1 Tax=Clastoptera arizonana TaxID=38151 RepID=A0A1B6BWU7_9HEMI
MIYLEKIICFAVISTNLVLADDCAIPSCLEKNTLCKFPTDEKSADCPSDFDDSFSQSQKDDVLHAHNKYRSQLAMNDVRDKNGKYFPPAANMIQLEWDDGIEKVAHRWLLQCKFSHDECRSSEKFKRMGQNLALCSAREKSHIVNVDNWQKEAENHCEWDVCMIRSDKKTGHFTQLGWATSSHLGCAKSMFTKKFKTDNLYCNYGPAGNWAGRPMYKQGMPCTECPEGMSCSRKYPGLCTGGPDKGATPPKFTIKAAAVSCSPFDMMYYFIFISLIHNTFVSLKF